jgi:hypothetical protein
MLEQFQSQLSFILFSVHLAREWVCEFRCETPQLELGRIRGGSAPAPRWLRSILGCALGLAGLDLSKTQNKKKGLKS